jgi:hypothetical protein
MRASLLELVSHLRDRLADQADGKAQRLRESTLQKLRDFLGMFSFLCRTPMLRPTIAIDWTKTS